MASHSDDSVDDDGGAIGRRRRAARLAGGEEYEAKRREALEAAAHVFRRKGYQATRLRDISDELGADRATLYYYFSGKEDLLREVVFEFAEQMTQSVRMVTEGGGSARNKIRGLLCALMESFEAHFPYPYVFIQENLDVRLRDEATWIEPLTERMAEVQRVARDILRQGIAEGDLRPDLPLEPVVNAMFGMVNWTHRWFEPGQARSGDEIADVFAALMLDGVAVERGA